MDQSRMGVVSGSNSRGSGVAAAAAAAPGPVSSQAHSTPSCTRDAKEVAQERGLPQAVAGARGSAASCCRGGLARDTHRERHRGGGYIHD